MSQIIKLINKIALEIFYAQRIHKRINICNVDCRSICCRMKYNLKYAFIIYYIKVTCNILNQRKLHTHKNCIFKKSKLYTFFCDNILQTYTYLAIIKYVQVCYKACINMYRKTCHTFCKDL